MTIEQRSHAEAGDQGERQAIQLADRLRALAATDPDLAQDLVDKLITALDAATDGLFTEHIENTANRPLVTSANGAGAGDSSAGNS
jgi:tRNA splicing ligase